MTYQRLLMADGYPEKYFLGKGYQLDRLLEDKQQHESMLAEETDGTWICDKKERSEWTLRGS